MNDKEYARITDEFHQQMRQSRMLPLNGKWYPVILEDVPPPPLSLARRLLRSLLRRLGRGSRYDDR